jgi:enoyl-CoA hydratase/carnithine racemase
VKKFGYEADLRAAAGLVLYEVDPGEAIAYVTLNRPEKRNALSVAMRQRIVTLMAEANADPAVRVIVLRGAGSCFSSGDQLNEDWGQRKPGERRHTITQSYRYGTTLVAGRTGFVQAISRSAKPVIARVHGYCYGAGYSHLAAQCDIVVAAPDAQFGSPQSRYLGATVPGPRHIRILGPKAALRLGFTGALITGAEAHRLGLVDALAPVEALDARVTEICREITRQPTDAVLGLKARLRASEAAMGVLMPTLVGAGMGHLLRRDEDEQDFWANARAAGVGAALARDRSRKGVINPRVAGPTEADA